MLLLAFSDPSHEFVIKRLQPYVHGENYAKQTLESIESNEIKETANILQGIIKRMSYLDQLQK